MGGMKMRFLVILLLIMPIIGIATVEASESELIIIRTDSDDYLTAYVTVDGGKRIKFKPGEKRIIKISNGSHIINGLMPEWKGTKELVGFKEGRGSVSFTCENERIEYSFSAIQIGSSFRDSFTFVKRTSISQQKIETPSKDVVINNSFNKLNTLIPSGSTIAIMDITPKNSDTTFIQEELTVLFVNTRKFKIVERKTLDTIRTEQRFQMLGEVSDETAISMGQFLGADVVIIGNITGDVPHRRLRLRAINVKTAEIIAMSSESI